jgi:glycosyltransferase involved in cell wall biosynthesis
LLAAFRSIFGRTKECHIHIWEGIEDKSQATGIGIKLTVLLKLLLAYPVLVIRYLLSPEHRYVLVPYLGIFDVVVLYPFARLRGARICLDVFISIYDTAVIDRGIIDPESFLAKLLYRFERFAINLADIALVDTNEHGRYLEELFDMPRGCLRTVWVGVEEQCFTPARSSSRKILRRDPKRVLFFGQFIPLHGIDVIVEAAEILEKQENRGDYEWLLIGKGQMQPAIDRMIAEKNLSSVKRLEWVPYEELVEQIRQADICLGIFGSTGKSQRVIPNKVFQILAVGTPLITADTPAIREVISPSAKISLIQPGSAEDLADAVVDMVARLDSYDDDAASARVVDALVVAEQLGVALRE